MYADTVNGYCVENVNFSSKKTALDSMAYIREHLIRKFDLDIGHIENYGTTSVIEQFHCMAYEQFNWWNQMKLTFNLFTK